MLEDLAEAFPTFVKKVHGNSSAFVEHVIPGISDKEIANVETELGVPLPTSYKVFLRAVRGLWLFGGAVQFGAAHPFIHDFPALTDLTPAQRRIVKAKGGGWPPPSHGMLCFAEYFLEADGDQVLFDVSNGLVDDEYPVVYYSHESRPPGVRVVAANFADWLNRHCLDEMDA